MKQLCKFCNKQKDFLEFSPRKKGKNGLNSKCKNCCTEEQKKRYCQNKELYQERARRYRKDNPNLYKAIGKKYKENNPIRIIFDGARYRAKIKNIECNIELSDIIIPEFCPILDIKIEFSKITVKDNSPSIDRIDPNKGYIKGNIRVISHKANRMKNNCTLEELKKLIKYIEYAI